MWLTIIDVYDYTSVNITHHFCRSVELGVHLHKNFSRLFVFSNFCVTFTLPSAKKKIWNPFTC